MIEFIIRLIIQCLYSHIELIDETNNSIVFIDKKRNVAIKFAEKENIEHEYEMYKLIPDDVKLNFMIKTEQSFPYYFLTQKIHHVPYCLEMPLMDSDVFNLINNHNVSEKSRLHIACGMIQCVLKFHQKNLVHNDIKPENFLVDKNHKVFLTDFTSVCNVDEKEHKYLGTLQFFPENVVKNKYFIPRFSYDIHSLCCSLLLVIANEYNKNLFKNKNIIKQILRTNNEKLDKIITILCNLQEEDTYESYGPRCLELLDKM